MSPGGLRGLQIRWGALGVSSVGSTPMRSRQYHLGIQQHYTDIFLPTSTSLLL
jgi:hypothetical protein